MRARWPLGACAALAWALVAQLCAASAAAPGRALETAQPQVRWWSWSFSCERGRFKTTTTDGKTFSIVDFELRNTCHGSPKGSISTGEYAVTGDVSFVFDGSSVTGWTGAGGSGQPIQIFNKEITRYYGFSANGGDLQKKDEDSERGDGGLLAIIFGVFLKRTGDDFTSVVAGSLTLAQIQVTSCAPSTCPSPLGLKRDLPGSCALEACTTAECCTDHPELDTALEAVLSIADFNLLSVKKIVTRLIQEGKIHNDANVEVQRLRINVTCTLVAKPLSPSDWVSLRPHMANTLGVSEAPLTLRHHDKIVSGSNGTARAEIDFSFLTANIEEAARVLERLKTGKLVAAFKQLGLALSLDPIAQVTIRLELTAPSTTPTTSRSPTTQTPTPSPVGPGSTIVSVLSVGDPSQLNVPALVKALKDKGSVAKDVDATVLAADVGVTGAFNIRTTPDNGPTQQAVLLAISRTLGVVAQVVRRGTVWQVDYRTPDLIVAADVLKRALDLGLLSQELNKVLPPIARRLQGSAAFDAQAPARVLASFVPPTFESRPTAQVQLKMQLRHTDSGDQAKPGSGWDLVPDWLRQCFPDINNTVGAALLRALRFGDDKQWNEVRQPVLTVALLLSFLGGAVCVFYFRVAQAAGAGDKGELLRRTLVVQDANRQEAFVPTRALPPHASRELLRTAAERSQAPRAPLTTLPGSARAASFRH